MRLLLVTGVQTCADRKSTRLNSSHDQISYAVFCLKIKKFFPPEQIIVSEPNAEPGAPLQNELGISMLGDNLHLAASADTFFFFFKTQRLSPIFPQFPHGLVHKL